MGKPTQQLQYKVKTLAHSESATGKWGLDLRKICLFVPWKILERGLVESLKSLNTTSHKETLICSNKRFDLGRLLGMKKIFFKEEKIN